MHELKHYIKSSEANFILQPRNSLLPSFFSISRYSGEGFFYFKEEFSVHSVK